MDLSASRLAPTPRAGAAYRRLQIFAAAVLAVQFVVGLGGTLTAQREIFPFASWFLFSLVPDRIVSYDVRLRGSEQRPIDPVPFNQAGKLAKSPHSVTAYQILQQLGRAVEAGRPEEIRRRRRDFEAQLASSRDGMQYDVMRMAYRLAERWKTRQPPEAVTLATFRAGEDLP